MADINRLPGAQLYRWEWQRGAACRGMDSSLFFHPPNERDTARADRAARAKAIRRCCPVITECLDHALRVREPYGVWGGHTEDERARLLGVQSLRYPAAIRGYQKARTGPAARARPGPRPRTRNWAGHPDQECPAGSSMNFPPRPGVLKQSQFTRKSFQRPTRRRSS